MWCLSVTLFIFCINSSIEANLYNNNLEKIVNESVKGKSDAEWKGFEDRKDVKNNVDSKKKEIEWRVNKDDKNSENEYGVSIGYDKQIVGKELRVNEGNNKFYNLGQKMKLNSIDHITRLYLNILPLKGCFAIEFDMEEDQNTPLTLKLEVIYIMPLVNEEEVTNEDNFVRPCAFDDWECIRKFFARNSGCKPAYGPAPDPLTLAQNTIYFPFSNMTYTLIDLKIRGLSSSKIVELYLNKETGDVVFAIQVRNLNETTPHGYFSFRRTAKESIVLKDSVTILFKEVIFTAVIPKLPKLRLDLAEIHIDIREAVPVAIYGPKAYTSKDPTVIKSFANFLVSFSNIVREGTFFQAPLLTSLFIQSNVCDFGIELISV